VDSVPDPLLLRKSGSAHCYSENRVVPGIEPGTSFSEARNSDHETTEAVSVTEYKMEYGRSTPVVRKLILLYNISVASFIL
jgi:hypothetical protein